MSYKNILHDILTTFILGVIIISIPNCNNIKQRNTSEKKEQVNNKKTSNYESFPILVVRDGKDRNLGKIREGIKTSVTFTLLNKGEANATDISVHDLSKGGCTAVSRVSYLAANDSVKMNFIFETLGYAGKKVTRKIKIKYDNPKLSPLILSVSAEVIPNEEYQVPIGELYYNFFVLVDVRNENAFRKGHIAGAINIPDEKVISWASKLNKDFIIYLYSDDGKKSDILAKKLREKGFTEALSIIGGINEWKRRYGNRVIIDGLK